jgi:uncharacterized membrane protein YeaQ/YmgE (transglycosylase-associated protein family)
MDVANLITWLVLGLIAGALAGFVMRGGYGIVGDIIVGILGAFIGGYVFSLVGGGGVTGLNIGSIFVAFVGACILIALLRLLSRGRAV